MYVLVIISIESSIQMDVTAKKEELNFFFFRCTVSLEEKFLFEWNI